MTAIFRLMGSVFRLRFSSISRRPSPGGAGDVHEGEGRGEGKGARGKHLELPTHPHVNTRELTPPSPPHSPVTHTLSREEGVICTAEKARQKKIPHCRKAGCASDCFMRPDNTQEVCQQCVSVQVAFAQVAEVICAYYFFTFPQCIWILFNPYFIIGRYFPFF